MKVHLVSLGCARNLVDSEEMLGRLEAAGWSPTGDPAEAHAIVVNTCSFIEPAVEESVDTILAMARFKTRGVCRRLIVAGCLPERFREEIVGALPEVDSFVGTGAFDKIVAAVAAAGKRPGETECLLPDPDRIDVAAGLGLRRLSTGPMAYLKIAEGCSRQCTYCIIPKLRGRQKSLPPAQVAVEARRLIAAGARELVLVAQETTAYGRDLTPPVDLSDLLRRLAGIDETVWIRSLYGHPSSLTAETIRTVAAHPNICPYFDIPVQHASPGVLQRMGRRYGTEDLCRLFADIRAEVSDAALRTTVIVGFPGETRGDFDRLVEFIRTVRFDHLGVFVYSDSEDLPSHRLERHVTPKTAHRRRDRLMEIQAGISLEANRRRIGETLAVLIEGKAAGGRFRGRTMFQAPEVDGVTLVGKQNGGGLSSGQVVRVEITGAGDYDLEGVCV